jgi:hypothetical protein
MLEFILISSDEDSMFSVTVHCCWARHVSLLYLLCFVSKTTWNWMTHTHTHTLNFFSHFQAPCPIILFPSQSYAPSWLSPMLTVSDVNQWWVRQAGWHLVPKGTLGLKGEDIQSAASSMCFFGAAVGREGCSFMVPGTRATCWPCYRLTLGLFSNQDMTFSPKNVGCSQGKPTQPSVTRNGNGNLWEAC